MKSLPEGWKSVNIDSIAEIISGGTPSSKNPEYFTEEHEQGIAWITPADLSNYKKQYIAHGKRSITQSGYDSCSAKLMPKGAVLFSSRAPIGYVAIAQNEISTNQGFKSFVPHECTDTQYLYYYLKSIKHLAESLATGTTFKELSGKVAKTLPFPLAPLPEQKRIVAKLDEVLAQVDTIKARLDGIPAILKRFRQSVLAAAVSGKLTEEWRGDNDYLFNEDGKANFPRSWSVKVIDDVADVKGGKRLPKGEELVSEDTGFPYIRAGQLKFGTVITGSEARNSQMYLLPHVQSQISRYIVSEGDAYITIVGASIGDAGTIPTSHDGANLTENAAKLCNFVSDYNSEFLGLWLRSEILQSLIKLEIKSGAQGKLALIRIKALPCPKPTVDEQKEIVRLVDQYFAFADTIEAQVKKAQARVDNLTQSILAKAFRGELVPQDPADEPAEVLLTRIAQARKEAEALAKAAKRL